jgi:hypothetical protein
MTTTIVKVPSTWMVFLPNHRWVNLAQISEAQFFDERGHLVVTWSNGESTTFEGDQAIALVQHLIECLETMKPMISQILVP